MPRSTKRRNAGCGTPLRLRDLTNFVRFNAEILQKEDRSGSTEKRLTLPLLFLQHHKSLARQSWTDLGALLETSSNSISGTMVESFGPRISELMRHTRMRSMSAATTVPSDPSRAAMGFDGL